VLLHNAVDVRVAELRRVLGDDAELAYDASGMGEPVVFVHGALIADAFRPLLAEPALARRYRLIAYHRRGYGGSSHPPGPAGGARQAADCRTLLRHLGVARAHVVGHSYGGAVALSPRFAETYRLLLAWLPHAEGFVLPGATHLMHLESPSRSRGLAGALGAFFARHPLPAGDP
jgi:pimeloyl-ACP methyl ester carboxylesterase